MGASATVVSGFALGLRPSVISLFQIDCFGAAGCSVFASAGFALRLNEISFFHADFGSSPGAAGTFGTFGFRRKEISFFQIDGSLIVLAPGDAQPRAQRGLFLDA